MLDTAALDSLEEQWAGSLNPVFEHRHVPLLPRPMFLRRLANHFAIALAVLGVSLIVGMAGYEYFEELSWRDAFLNAAMLLGGEGPVESPQTPGGKVFAGLYALYAGVIFIIVTGIVLAPVVHRLLHRFHWSRSGQ